MIYLIKTVETYRADSAAEAQRLIDDAKRATDFELTKYSSETKPVKEQGEVVDEYQVVQLYKSYDNMKEPEGNVIYDSPVESDEF